MQPVTGRLVYAVAAIVLAACLVTIQRSSRELTHCAVSLEGGIPAVVYQPGPARPCFGDATAPDGDPVPAVVLAHGFAANKGMMKALARTLVRAGYGVVTFDFRGHGQNPAGFDLPGSDPRGGLTQDFERVVRYARGHPGFDPERIAVAGHSMGGGAALAYGSWDPGLAAVIGNSGGWGSDGPYPPPNLLLIWADGDAAPMRAVIRSAGAEIAGLERLVLDKTYGELDRGGGVRLTEVPDQSHVSILYSDEAADRIVRWLNQSLGPGRRTQVSDAPLAASTLGLVAFLVLLWGLPRVTRRWVPAEPLPPLESPFVRLGWLAVALVAGALALSAVDASSGVGPFAFLPIKASREIASLLFVTGTGLLVWGAARTSLPRFRLLDPRVLAASAIFFGFVYLALGSVLLPRLDLFLPAHRFWLWPALLLCFLPWFAANEWLLRGPGWTGVWLPIAGKALTLAAIAAGAMLGLLPFVVLLALPGLALLFAIVEVLAARISRTTPNPALAALAQSACTAWVMGSIWPMQGGA